jgi:hypothetical protein
VQWVFPTIALGLVWISPESPTQLVKQGRPEQALDSLRRLRPSESDETALVRLAGAQLAVAASIDEAKSQSDSYVECFKGVDLRRTLIVIVVSPRVSVSMGRVGADPRCCAVLNGPASRSCPTGCTFCRSTSSVKR